MFGQMATMSIMLVVVDSSNSCGIMIQLAMNSMNQRRMKKSKKELIGAYFRACTKAEEREDFMDAMACYEECFIDDIDPSTPGLPWQYLILK